jgi:hypothetical protein
MKWFKSQGFAEHQWSCQKHLAQQDGDWAYEAWLEVLEEKVTKQSLKCGECHNFLCCFS